jgi:hypothetical protein
MVLTETVMTSRNAPHDKERLAQCDLISGDRHKTPAEDTRMLHIGMHGDASKRLMRGRSGPTHVRSAG